MTDFAVPLLNLAQLTLPINPSVADFGAGSGHYALALALRFKQEGQQGQVYAIDVQKKLLERIGIEAEREHLTNIRTLWGDLDRLGGSKLADNSVDAVIVSNVLFQAEHKDTLLREAYRVCKPSGQLMLVDWSDSYGNLGPTPEMVLPASEAKRLATSAGWKEVRDFSAGAHHYGIIFKNT